MTMADPLDKATSKAPSTLGEGCLSRYDPDEMSPEDGTEFPGAAELWEQLQQQPEDKPKPA
jgi:hypothetical protein